MPDPRNVAHDQTVQQEKKNHHEPVAPADAAETVQPGRKPTMKHHAGDANKTSETSGQDKGAHEKS